MESNLLRQYHITLWKYRKFRHRLDKRLKSNTLSELSIRHRNRLLQTTIERLRKRLATLQAKLKYATAGVVVGAAIALSTPAFAQQPSPIGPEFRVNTFTTNNQSAPSLAMDSDGDYVIAWLSFNQDGSEIGIYAQRYHASGQPDGGEFRVNTYTTGTQSAPSVAMDSDGDFVITWISANQDGSFTGVYAQRYNMLGAPQGGEFRVNTHTTLQQTRPSVAMDSDGDFVVAWVSYYQDGGGGGIYAQRYNASGVPQGSEFRVNTFTTNHQIAPSIALDSDGDFVITWQTGATQDGSGYGVYAQRYTASGLPQGGEFKVNSFTTGNQAIPDIAMQADGTFVIAWNSNGQDGSVQGIYAQRYEASGVPLGVEFLVNTYTTNEQRLPSVAVDSEGDFVITWYSYQDGGSWGIYARRYRESGEPIGGEFRVNTFTTNGQTTPSIAIDSDGDFLIVWTSYTQDGSNYGVYAQRYTVQPPPAPLSSEFRVNTFTTNNQLGSSIAGNSDGQYVIVWHSDGQDGNLEGIYAQRYNAQGQPEGIEFRANTWTTAGQRNPSVAMDSDGDFVIAWESNTQDGSGFGIYAQRYNAMGLPQGSEFRVSTYTTLSQASPKVAIDSDGDFVVVWQSDGQDGSGYGIYAQRYNASGISQGAEFRVNTYTTGGQGSPTWAPAVAMSPSGDFVVAWHSKDQDGSDWGIYAQRYNASGTPQGAEFRVSTYSTLIQASPSIGIDANGDFVISWHSQNQDGSGYGVYAQRYNATGGINGNEFAVNTYTTGNQFRSAAGMDAAGNFVITWMSSNQDGSGYGVYAQRYSAIGEPRGGEFKVNTYTTNHQRNPSIGLDSDGDFVIAWYSTGQEGSGYGVYAQRYTVQPPPELQGGEFQVNTFTTNNQSTHTVAMDRDGDFVVTWQSHLQDGSSQGVYAQRYNALGQAQGAEFRANTFTASAQGHPSVGVDSDGDFVITWQGADQEGPSYAVYAQRYNSSGVPQGSEFKVNTYSTNSQRSPSIAMNSTGDFVIAWTSLTQDGDGDGIFAQRYNNLGQPQGGEFQVNTYTTNNQHLSSIAMDQDGNFVIAWTSTGQDTSSSGVYFKRYNSSGIPQGGEFRANTFTTNGQGEASVAMDEEGSFVITWSSDLQDGSNSGIYGQRYDAAGSPLGSEFRVNTYTTLTQYTPAVSIDSDGDFVIAWTSQNQDGGDFGVYAQRYNASGQPQGTEFRVNTTTTNWQQFPSIALDADGDFVIIWESLNQDGNNMGIFGQLIESANPNAAPVLQTNTGLTVDEGDEGTIMSTALNVTDTDNAVEEILYEVTALPENGELQNGGEALGLNDNFSQEDINNSLITYTHDGSETTSDSFSFAVTDGYTTLPVSAFTITIVPASDAPVLQTNAGLAIDEGDESIVSGAVLSSSDVDDPATDIIYEVTTLPVNGELQKNGVAILLYGTFSQADINNSQITYTHNGSETSGDSFGFTVTDGNTTLSAASFDISITAVNDAPVIQNNNEVGVGEGNDLVVFSGFLSTMDSDNPATAVVYTLTVLPAHGDLQKNGVAMVVSGTFSQQDINDELINYSHDGGETTSDAFSFTVTDGNTTLTEAAFHIIIGPANDAPVFEVNGMTVNEGSKTAIDPDALNTTDAENPPSQLTYRLVILPLRGTLSKNEAVLEADDTFTQSDINGGLIEYTHNGTETVTDFFTFNVSDGAITTVDLPFTLTITPQNDPPVLQLNAPLIVTEGSSAPINFPNLLSADIDNLPSQVSYVITELPVHGELAKEDVPLALNESFTEVELSNNFITYTHDGSETTSDSFSFTLTDGVATIAEATFTFVVSPINDAPVLQNTSGLTVPEGSEGAISVAELQSTDADNPATEIVYVITAFPLNGTLKKNGVAPILNNTFTQADINNGLITYAHSGAAIDDSFIFSLTDGYNILLAQTFSIHVTSVDHPPVLETNVGLTIDEGDSKAISSSFLRATDADNSAAQILFKLTSLPSNGAVKFNGVALSLNNTFSQEAINNNQITYAHDGSETTDDSFSFQVSDGITTLPASVFQITVNPVTDGLLAQTITFAALSDKTDGDAAFTLSGNASSGLTVQFSVVSGPATINGSTLTLTGPGPVTVRASQAGNSTFNPATAVDRTFCSNPKKPSITAQDEDTEAPKLISSAATGNQWFRGTQPLAGETNSTLTVTLVGIYRVQVTVGGCTGAMSNDFALVITRDQSTPSNAVTLYPNPVPDFVTIDGLSGSVIEVSTTDVSGKRQDILFQRTGRQVILDVRGLSGGAYLVRIVDGERIHRLKFIKH